MLKSVLPIVGIFLLIQCESKKTDLSEDVFKNPSTDNRPLALWPWLNGYIDTTKMVYELEEMKAKGMRGAVIWDIGALADPEKIIPAGPAFLGPLSLEYISLALQTTGKLGLDLGMVASSSWNAGGEWVEEKNASMELIHSSQVVEGSSKQKITIQIPVSRFGEPIHFSLVSSLAVPYSEEKLIDYSDQKTILLDEFVSNDNHIEWDVPEGKWEIISFFMSNTGQELVCPSPNSTGLIIDHLSRIATKNHFDSLLTRLATVSSQDNHMKFFMLDSYEVWHMKDWSPEFVAEFRKRYGYDPLPYLPLLNDYSAKDTIMAERFRSDYSRLVSDMMIENHFEQSVTIADKLGIEMLTEAGHGGSPRVDPLKALGNSHIPMGEFWNRRRFWVTKEAASAAHIYGKKIVASESLTGWNHWQHGPTDFKQLIDIAFCEGLNQIVFHTFTHNPMIAGKPGFVYHAGEHVNVNATWWEMARPFMDYIARCSYMLRQGNFVGDACLYYGDQAPNLVPPKRIDPNITPIYGEGKCLHCGEPVPIDPGDMHGYDYDYINADIIINTLAVDDGNLVLPSGQSYRLIMLPDRVDISLEVLKSLKNLVINGAIVIGPRPERTTSLKDYPGCDTEVKAIADELWGKSDGKDILVNNYGKGRVYWGKSPKEVLEELNIPPDFKVIGTDNTDYHIDYIHRQTETEDIYFVSNSNNEVETVTCVFRVDKNRTPEIWDPETGLIQRDVKYTSADAGTSIELVMDPLASRLVVFRSKSSGQNDTGLSYDLQYGFSKIRKAGGNIETVDISDNWNINFNPQMGGPQSYQLDKLISWPEIENQGIKYYSGKATYARSFTVPEPSVSKETEAFVFFGDIQEMARVFVNGNDCGIVWVPPYKARVTPFLKAGENNITVEVINTWNNRIVGDLKSPDKMPFTHTNAKTRFKADSPLLTSGLMGKAELVFITNP